MSIVGFTETPVDMAGGTTIAVTRTITAGNTVLIYATCGWSGGTTIAYSGTVGTGYGVALAPVADPNNDQCLGVGKVENHPGGSTVFTATFSASRGFRGITVVEVAGSGGIDDADGQYQQFSGTVADAVTTPALTAAKPGLLVGVSMCTGGITTPCAAGTGLTSAGTFWTSTFGTPARVASKTVTAGSVAPTFTSSSNQSYVTIGVIVSDPSGPTITSQPSDSHVAAGATASFSVTASASGGGSLSYQWQVNGVNVTTGTGGTTANYAVAVVLADDGNSYTCAVEEIGGTDDGTRTSLAGLARVGLIRALVGVAAFGTTSVTPAYPSGIQAGDEIVLWVGQKPSTANSGSLTTPSGFDAPMQTLTGAGGYGATLAGDTGNTNLWALRKTTVTGSESGTLSVSLGTSNVCWASFVVYRAPPGQTISFAGSTGSDTSAGNVSITCAADPGLAAGDHICGAFCDPTDAATFSAEAITATGCTFGTVAELAEPLTSTGNDLGGFVIGARVETGPSSAAPVFTATTGGTTTNARGPGILLRLRAAGSGPQSITPGGISSLEALGAAALALLISSSGIGTAEAFGSATISQSQLVAASGIGNAEAFGSPALSPGSVSVAPAGLAGAESFGSCVVAPGAVSVAPGGVATSEALGAPAVAPGAAPIAPAGLASPEAFGSSAVSPGAVALVVSGVSSAEVFGSHACSSGGVGVITSGVVSLEAFGAGALSLALLSQGIAGAEAFGAHALGLWVACVGASSTEAFGSASLVPGAAPIVASSASSSEAFGAHTVAPGAAPLSPSGIASTEAFGTHLCTGGAGIVAPGIASLEALGTCAFGLAALPSGVATGGAFGTALFAIALSAGGVGTAEGIGSPTLGLFVACSGIGTAEGFGTAACTQPGGIAAPGIASSEAFGTTTLVPGGVSILGQGVASGEAHGAATLASFSLVTPASVASLEALGALTASSVASMSTSGIAGEEAFGALLLGLFATASGVGTGEAFGALAIAISGQTLQPAGIASLDAFGVGLLVPGVAFLLPSAVASAEAVGLPSVVGGIIFVLAGLDATIFLAPPEDTLEI